MLKPLTVNIIPKNQKAIAVLLSLSLFPLLDSLLRFLPSIVIQPGRSEASRKKRNAFNTLSAATREANWNNIIDPLPLTQLLAVFMITNRPPHLTQFLLLF